MFKVASIQYLKSEKITWIKATSYILLSVWAMDLETKTEEQTIKTINYYE